MRCVDVGLGNVIGARHVGTRKHMLGGGGGKVDGDGGRGEDKTKGKHNPFTTLSKKFCNFFYTILHFYT